MTWVSLEEAKEQLALEADDPLHDARLQRLIVAAECWAAGFLARPLSDLVAEVGDSPSDGHGHGHGPGYGHQAGESPASLPEDVKSALLLHVEWEFDRDTQNGAMLLQRAHDLLWPYRNTVAV